MKLYDSYSRSLRDFVPLRNGEVSMYLCGATVQGSPHIGHMRSTIVFDVLRRYFEYKNLKVLFVRNVTDIDDKILHNAGHEDISWWELAAKYEKEFSQAYEDLGNIVPSIEPRATGHIPQMIEMIEQLIEKNYAYVAEGSVWFAVKSFKDYGKLSGQKVEEMLAAQDLDKGKKDPHDFALWKKSKEGEPFWNSPWGQGRPGWHIECSAMAKTYLGEKFDIHGGGLDLQFPHHENEIAQSKASGNDFANFWVHNYWVTQSGEKMSKSLGNSLKVKEVITRFRPIDVRFYLLSAHYRSNLEFSDQALSEAATAFSRIEQFVQRASEKTKNNQLNLKFPQEFIQAIEDDLATPLTISIIHEYVTKGNTALTNNESKLVDILNEVRSMLYLLGLDPMSSNWNSQSSNQEKEALDKLISELLNKRNQARANKDFALADSMRDALKNAGILIEDGADGSRWTIEKEVK
ncbi:MAG: cysteine--tRNA ligase [Actinobacteria bacterium]|nr:cysteine--tRNA ligase [Actinomycetota bacterium]